jgi:hypothetical protein
MRMERERHRGRWRDLIGLGEDLRLLADDIAAYAEREVAPYVGPPIPRQVAELIEARKVRERMFNMDLTHPAWTFLLSLYCAHLQGEALALEGEPKDVQLDRLCRVAMVTVEGRSARLTDFGARLVEYQFKAEKLALQLLV